jgi:hypothetical protein
VSLAERAGEDHCRVARVRFAGVDANEWLIALSAAEGTRLRTTPFSDLTPPEQVFLAIWTLESDVNNGGFDQ